jgi:hypothetical protein
MKRNLLLAAAFLMGGFAFAQTTEVSLTLQPTYSDQVYYKFATNTHTSAAANSWDLAFQKASGMGLGGIRVNDGRGIVTYQVALDFANWGSIDVANQTTWTPLYNSDANWATGSFNNSSAPSPLNFGWGNYDMATHNVNGVVLFVLKYSATSFKKVFIQNYNPFTGVTTFVYSTWDGTSWSADQTATIGDLSTEGPSWNYYSLDTNAAVTVAPADADWDLVFRKYYTNLSAEGETPMMYSVTGALHSPAVTVAETDEAGTSTTPVLPVAAAYSNVINTIGYDWKTLSGSSYVVDPNQTFYVKYADGTIYRLYFTSFAGSSTGNLTFNTANVTPTAGLEEVNQNLSFGFYPNPTSTKNITLFYDLKNSTAASNNVSIYSMTGAKVYETKIANSTGFYSKEVSLSSLSAGIYIVKLDSGSQSVTKKLIIQ